MIAVRGEIRPLSQEFDQTAADDAEPRDTDPPGFTAHCSASANWSRAALRIWPDWSRNFFTLRAA